MPQDQDRQVTLEEFEEQRRKYYSLPKGMTEALKTQESGGRQYDQSGGVLTSPKQAKGRLQVLQSTADQYGLNADDPFENIEAGYRYLSELNKKVDSKVTNPGERWAQTLAGYHAGEGRLREVNKTGVLPATSDGKIRTDEYVSSIMKRWQEYDQGQAAPAAEQPQTPAQSVAKPRVSMGTGDLVPQRPQRPPTARERKLAVDETARAKAAPDIAKLVQDFEALKREGSVDAARSVAAKIKQQYGRWMEVGEGAGYPYVKSRIAGWNPVQPPAQPPGPTIEQQQAEFASRPMVEQLGERAIGALTRGGGHVSKMARQALGFGMGAAGVAQGRPFKVEDFPTWRAGEEARMRVLEEQRQGRPSSFASEVAEGIIEGAPAAGAAVLGGALTGGGLPAMAAIGGGMGAAGADWSNPKRSAAQTAIGAVAPIAGGKIGSSIGGAIANRLAPPAAQALSRAGGELLGGGLGNVIGGGAEQLAFEGRIDPRTAATQFAIGAGLNVPGMIAAARGRPPLPPIGAQSAAQPAARPGAPADVSVQAALPPGVRIVRQGEPIPPRQVGQRQLPLEIQSPDGTVETVLVIADDRINGQRVNETMLRPMVEQALLQPTPAAQPAPAEAGTPPAQPQPQPQPVQARTPGGAIIAQPSSLPSRKLLEPGRPADVPTEQLQVRPMPPDAQPTQRMPAPVYPDAQVTQEMPAFRERIRAENAPTAELQALPVRAPQEFVRPTAELPRRVMPPIRQTAEEARPAQQEPASPVSQPLEGQPVELPSRKPPAPSRPAGGRFPRPLEGQMYTGFPGDRRAMVGEGRRVGVEIEAGRGEKGQYGKIAQRMFKSASGQAQKGADSFFNDNYVKGALGLSPDASMAEVRLEMKKELARAMGVKSGEISLTQVNPPTWAAWARQKGLPAESKAKMKVAIERYQKGILDDTEKATPAQAEQPSERVGAVREAATPEPVGGVPRTVAPTETKPPPAERPIDRAMRETRERRQQREETATRFIEERGEVAFQAPVQGDPNRFVIAHRSTKYPGKWQFSLFDEQGAVGDMVTDDYREGLLRQIHERHVDLSQAVFQPGKPKATQAAPVAPTDLVQRITQLARTPTSPVEISKLREAFPNLNKADFDTEMAKLNEEGRIALHRHDHPQSLSEAERGNLVQIGNDYFTAATLREKPKPKINYAIPAEAAPDLARPTRPSQPKPAAPRAEPKAEAPPLQNVPGIVVNALKQINGVDINRARVEATGAEYELKAIDAQKLAQSKKARETVEQAKVQAAKNGWDWNEVEALAKKQAGVDENWHTPREAEDYARVKGILERKQADRAQRQVRVKEMAGKQQAKAEPEAEAPPRKLKVEDIPQAAPKDLDDTSRAIETRFRDYLANNFDEAVARYRKQFGKEINTNNARELSEDYARSDEARSLYSPAVHEPSSWFAKELYKLMLAEKPGKGQDASVFFTAGGTGAGKTSTITESDVLRAHLGDTLDRSQMIMDGNLNNAKKAIQKIDQALAAGKKVTVAATYRDPVESWQGGVLPRAQKKGRAVPMGIHVETHSQMRDALIGITEHYKNDPRVKITFIDNTHGKGNALPSENIDLFREIRDTKLLREQLVKETNEAYEKGKISERVLKGSFAGPPGGHQQEVARGVGSRPGVSETPELQPDAQRRGGAPDTAGAAEDVRRGVLEQAAPGRRARGDESTLTIPRGEDRPVRYEIRELGDLQASHDPFTFQKNPKYPYVNDRDYTSPANRTDVEENTKAGKFKPPLVINDDPTSAGGPPIIRENGAVLGGNSRTMMIARVYKNHPQDAEQYKKLLAKKASGYGIDPAELANFKEPVLVRVDSGAGGTQKLISDLNIMPGKAMTSTEAASARAKSMSGETLTFLADRLAAEGPEGTLAQALEGPKGVKILNRLIEDDVIPRGERNRYLSDQGNLSPAAKTEIEQILLGRVFRDQAQMKATAPEMRNKLVRVAPQLGKMAGTEWDITNLLPNAIEAVGVAKAQKLDLEMLNRRGNLFGEGVKYSPEELAIAGMLKDRGPAQIEKVFKRYATEFEQAQVGRGLFGEPPTQKEAFNDVFQPDQTPQGQSKPLLVQDAEQRLFKAGSGQLMGSGTRQMADVAIVAGWRVYKAGMKFAVWSKEVISRVGVKVKPHLLATWDKLNKSFSVGALPKEGKGHYMGSVGGGLQPGLFKKAPKPDIEALLGPQGAPQKVAPPKSQKLFKQPKPDVEALLGPQGAPEKATPPQSQKLFKGAPTKGELTAREKFGRKIGTVQTIAQLLNPKTISQNIIGNAAFSGAKNAATITAIPMDKFLSLFTKERQVATPAIGNQVRDFMGGFSDVYHAVRADDYRVLADNRYELANERVFKNKVGGFFEDVLNITLRGPDRGAFLAAYNDAVQQITRAHAKSKSKFSLDKIHEQAKLEAQQSVFQDKNMVSKFVVGLRNAFNRITPFGKKSNFGLGDMIGLKYARTPAGLVARGLEYSPLNFVNAFYKIGKVMAGKGKGFDQRNASLAFGKALVGSAFGSGLGAVLYEMGIIAQPEQENRGVQAAERGEGLTGYQLNLSALKRYATGGLFDVMEGKFDAGKKQKGDMLWSYDWLQPWAFSIGMGAAAMSAYDKRKADSSALDDTLTQIDAVTSTLTDQSILRNVRDLGKYGVRATARHIATDAPASFVPSILNQARQVIDDRAREISHERGARGVGREALDKVLNRLPKASERLPERKDIVGRSVPTRIEGKGGAALVAVPGRFSQYRPHPVLGAMQETGVGSTGASRKPGETEARFRARRTLEANWMNRYGMDLTRSPGFRLATREEKAEALKALKQRISTQIGKDEPNEDVFDPDTIIEFVRQKTEKKAQ